MNKKIHALKQFHTAFKLGYADKPTATIGTDKINLRHRLMAEENDEYLEAAKNGDLVEVADALGDMLYVLCGTIIEHGMHDKIDAVFEEIHRSNMSKLDADGKPIYREDGKVIKGDNYVSPELADLFR